MAGCGLGATMSRARVWTKRVEREQMRPAIESAVARCRKFRQGWCGRVAAAQLLGRPKALPYLPEPMARALHPRCATQAMKVGSMQIQVQGTSTPGAKAL